jgi:hypothetical protein
MSQGKSTGPFCNAKKRQGTGRCQLTAGHGTDHPGYGSCSRHGGSTAAGRKSAAMQMARHDLRVMGVPIPLDPHEAIELCIARAAGELAYCDARIAELRDADAAIIADETITDHQALDRDGGVHDLHDEQRSTNARLHIWITAGHAAEERLHRYAKAAAAMGVAERQVRIREGQLDQLAAVVNAVMAELVAAGLTDDLRRLARDSFARHATILESVPGTALEVTA